MTVAGPDRLSQTQAVLASLVGPAIAVAVTDPRDPQPAAVGQENAHLTRAFPKRQQEFAAGRAAARTAMAAFGIAPLPIPSAEDRTPTWPSGIRGSISHSDTLCVAAVTGDAVLLGVDVEPNIDLAPGLLSTICSDAEIARIAGPHQARLAKLIFSAKEAAFKAQYPVTRALFGFDHFDVTLDLKAQTFSATFTRPVGPFAVGDALPGRFDGVADHLVTAVVAEQATQKGA